MVHCSGTVLVAGVDLSPGEAWLLAKLLYKAGRTELAVEVGCAVDADRSELLLTWSEHVDLLLMLERECPEELVALREALWISVTRRRAV
jgi:hypothetical protein